MPGPYESDPSAPSQQYYGPYGLPEVYPFPNGAPDTYQASITSDYSVYGAAAAADGSASGYPACTPLGISSGSVATDPGSGAPDAAHYYSGYWAAVQAALYGPVAPVKDPYSFAISGVDAAIGAAIGRALVSPADAMELEDPAMAGEGPFGNPYRGLAIQGRDSPVVGPSFQSEGSGGSPRPTGLFETNIEQIEGGLARADEEDEVGVRNWIIDLFFKFRTGTNTAKCAPVA